MFKERSTDNKDFKRKITIFAENGKPILVLFNPFTPKTLLVFLLTFFLTIQ